MNKLEKLITVTYTSSIKEWLDVTNRMSELTGEMISAIRNKMNEIDDKIPNHDFSSMPEVEIDGGIFDEKIKNNEEFFVRNKDFLAYNFRNRGVAKKAGLPLNYYKDDNLFITNLVDDEGYGTCYGKIGGIYFIASSNYYAGFATKVSILNISHEYGTSHLRSDFMNSLVHYDENIKQHSIIGPSQEVLQDDGSISRYYHYHGTDITSIIEKGNFTFPLSDKDIYEIGMRL